MAQRNTVQQKIIAGQLAKLHGSHPTADEVYQSMKCSTARHNPRS